MKQTVQNESFFHFRRYRLWLVLLSVLLISSVQARSMRFQDTFPVSGVIKSESGETLPGATILVKNTTQGTVSDVDGNFRIETAEDAILVISFIGFQTKEVPVNGRTVLNIDLSADTDVLDEVVVVGYGTQKKSHLTGAISKVENKKLDQIPLSRADDALVGQVSGVNIQATGGDGNDQGVGSDPQIRIRGTGSITGGAGPLLVIDGTVVDSDFFGSIDMNDVESFEILKDAASAAIFGSRGANGVIMITTKQGKEGPTKFSYNAFVGIQDVQINPDYDFSAAETFAREIAFRGELSERSQYKLFLRLGHQ